MRVKLSETVLLLFLFCASPIFAQDFSNIIVRQRTPEGLQELRAKLLEARRAVLESDDPFAVGLLREAQGRFREAATALRDHKGRIARHKLYQAQEKLRMAVRMANTPWEEKFPRVLARIDTLLAKAEEIVSASGNDEAKALLDKAVELRKEASSSQEGLKLLFRARLLAREAIAVAKGQTLQAIRIVRGLPSPQEAAEKAIERAKAAVERAETALSGSSDARLRALLEKAQKMLDRASQAFEAERYPLATEIAHRTVRQAHRIVNIARESAPKGPYQKGNVSSDKVFALYQNRPNPFNPTTEISYSLPEQSNVTLKIYNLLGQEVCILADGLQPAGLHTVQWDGRDSNGRQVASGIYLYRLTAGSHTQTKRMFLAK